METHSLTHQQGKESKAQMSESQAFELLFLHLALQLFVRTQDAMDALQVSYRWLILHAQLPSYRNYAA